MVVAVSFLIQHGNGPSTRHIVVSTGAARLFWKAGGSAVMNLQPSMDEAC